MPLAESQFAHLPIVARNRSVVPETLGAGQILLGEDPAEYAAAMHRLRSCAEFREQTIQAGRRNYDSRFTPLVIETAFMEAVTSHTCAVL